MRRRNDKTINAELVAFGEPRSQSERFSASLEMKEKKDYFFSLCSSISFSEELCEIRLVISQSDTGLSVRV